MEPKKYHVTISDKDILKYGNDCTMSGQSIDMLAMAIGEWTEEDLTQNNHAYEYDGLEYIFEHFNFENALLEHGAAMAKEGNASGFIDEVLGYAAWLHEDEEKGNEVKYEQGMNLFMAYYRQKLQVGAWFAINYPLTWQKALEAFEERCEDLKFNYNEGELERIAPKLAAEITESIEDFWQELQEEWLNGSRDFAGILRIAAKRLSAESVEWLNQKNEIAVTWSDEGAREFLTGTDAEDKPSMAALKRELSYYIACKMNTEASKEQAEKERRKAERERVVKYQAERKQAAELERIEKLKTLKK